MREYTFEKRLGSRNSERAICRPDKDGCGQVHEWKTKGCKPAIFPDQWEGDREMDLERLPDDLDAVRLTG